MLFSKKQNLFLISLFSIFLFSLSAAENSTSSVEQISTKQNQLLISDVNEAAKIVQEVKLALSRDFDFNYLRQKLKATRRKVTLQNAFEYVNLMMPINFSKTPIEAEENSKFFLKEEDYDNSLFYKAMLKGSASSNTRTYFLHALLNCLFIPNYLGFYKAGEGFDSLIIYLPDSQEWIDLHSSHLQINSLSFFASDKEIFLTEEGEVLKQLKTPRLSAKNNVLAQRFDFHFQNYGLATIQGYYSYSGAYAAEKRDFISNTTKKEQKKFVEAILKNQFGSASDLRYEIIDGDKDQFPLVEKIEAKNIGTAYTKFDVATLVINENDLVALCSQFRSAYISRKANYNLMQEPSTFERMIQIYPPKNFVLDEEPKSEKIWIGPNLITREVAKNPDCENGLIITYSFSWDDEKLSEDDLDYFVENLLGFYEKRKPLVLNFSHEGRILFSQKEYQKTIELYKKQLALDPKNPLNYSRLALAHLDIRQGFSATEVIDEALKKFPDDIAVNFVAAVVAQHNGEGRYYKLGFDYNTVTKSLFKLLKLDKNNAGFMQMLFSHLLLSEDAVSGGSIENLNQACGVAKQILENGFFTKDQLPAVLFLAWYCDDVELIKALTFKEDRLTNLKEAMLVFIEEGSDALKNRIEFFAKSNDDQKTEEFFFDLGVAFIQKGSFDEIEELLTSLDETVKNNTVLSLEKSVKQTCEKSKSLEERTAEEFTDSKEEFAATEIVEKFFYELFNCKGQNYESLLELCLPGFYYQIANYPKSINLKSFFTQIVASSNLNQGTLKSRQMNFVNRLNTTQRSYLDEVFKVSIFSDSDHPINFFLMRDDEEKIKIAAIDNALDWLALELYETKTVSPEAALKMVSWAVDGYLKNIESTEEIEKNYFEVGFREEIFDKIYRYYVDKISTASEENKSRLIKEFVTHFLLNVIYESFEITDEAALLLLDPQGKSDEEIFYAINSALQYYLMTNCKAEFIELANSFYKKYQNSPRALRYYLEAMLLAGEKGEADIYAWIDEQEILSAEDKLHAYYLAASILMKSDYLVAALEENQNLLTDSQLASYYNLIAWISLFKEENPTEKDLFFSRRAVELTENKNVAILHTLATIYAKSGRCDEAIVLLDEIEALSPDKEYSPSDKFLFGLIMQAFGEKEIAMLYFALCLDTENPSLLEEPASCSRLIDMLIGIEKIKSFLSERF